MFINVRNLRWRYSKVCKIKQENNWISYVPYQTNVWVTSIDRTTTYGLVWFKIGFCFFLYGWVLTTKFYVTCETFFLRNVSVLLFFYVSLVADVRLSYFKHAGPYLFSRNFLFWSHSSVCSMVCFGTNLITFPLIKSGLICPFIWLTIL